MAEKAKKPRVKAKADAKGKPATKPEKPKAKAKSAKVKAKAKSKESLPKLHTHTGASKTARNKERVLAELREHGDFVTTACLKLGLSRRQFYNWLDEDSEFSEAYTEIRERRNDLVESVLQDAIFNAERDTDRLRAAESYLKAHAKDRGYGTERREQKHSGEITTTPAVIVRLPRNGRESDASN